MDERLLYQTFASNRPSNLHTHPIFSSQRTWVCNGYYFWDTHIENAHWWGNVHYGGNYIIGETSCDKYSRELYDLYGDLEKRKEFFEIASYLKEQEKKEVFVPDVISFIRRTTEFDEKYKAIRVYPLLSQKKDNSLRIKFVAHNISFMEKEPPVQICVLDLKFLTKPFQVVYSK